MHSILCIPSCDRRKNEEVKEDRGAGTLAHRIHICVCSWSWHQPGCINLECIEWESIDWECISQIVSISLYVFSRLLDLEFSQRSLFSKELEAGQTIM